MCEQVCACDQDCSCSSRRGTAPKRQHSTQLSTSGGAGWKVGWLRVPRQKRERRRVLNEGPSQALWMCVSLLGWSHPSSGPHLHHSEAPSTWCFMSRVHGRLGGAARRGTATGQRLHAQAQPLLTVTKDPAVQLTQCRGPGTDCTPAPRFTNPQCERDVVGTARLCFIQCHWGNYRLVVARAPTSHADSSHGRGFLAAWQLCPRGKCPERRWQLPPLPWPWKSLGILPPPPCCQLTVFKGRASTTQFPRPEGPAVRSCGPWPTTQPLELGPCDSRGLNACALLEAGRQVPSLCREQVYFPPGQLWEGSRHGHCRHLAVAGLQSEGSVPAGRLAAALWRPGLQIASQPSTFPVGKALHRLAASEDEPGGLAGMGYFY